MKIAYFKKRFLKNLKKMDRMKSRIRHMEVPKKAKKLWSEHSKNYSREELDILAKAAGIPYISTYKKHELALKLGVG